LSDLKSVDGRCTYEPGLTDSRLISVLLPGACNAHRHLRLFRRCNREAILGVMRDVRAVQALACHCSWEGPHLSSRRTLFFYVLSISKNDHRKSHAVFIFPFQTNLATYSILTCRFGLRRRCSALGITAMLQRCSSRIACCPRLCSWLCSWLAAADSLRVWASPARKGGSTLPPRASPSPKDPPASTG
jgi:hypothetical protein